MVKERAMGRSSIRKEQKKETRRGAIGAPGPQEAGDDRVRDRGGELPGFFAPGAGIHCLLGVRFKKMRSTTFWAAGDRVPITDLSAAALEVYGGSLCIMEAGVSLRCWDGAAGRGNPLASSVQRPQYPIAARLGSCFRDALLKVADILAISLRAPMCGIRTLQLHMEACTVAAARNGLHGWHQTIRGSVAQSTPYGTAAIIGVTG